MAGNTEDVAKDIVGAAKKGLMVLLKAAAITVGLAVVGGVIGGVAASAAAFGGLATFGMVAGGFIAGGFLGRAIATNYVMDKAGKAMVTAERFLDRLDKEMSPQVPKPAQQPAPLATLEAGGAFAEAATPAAAEDVPAAAEIPAAEQKQPAPPSP